MSFNSTDTFVEVFPEVDSRILRAVAIEHSKDADTAVEVVLSEVIPCLTKLPSTSSEHGGATIKSSDVDSNGAPQTDAALLHKTKDSDELQNGSSSFDAGCGHHQTIEDTDGESLQQYHDAVGGDHVPFEVDGGDKARVDVYEKSSHLLIENEKCGHTASHEATSFKVNKDNGADVAYNQLCQPTECVVSHNTLEGTHNSPSDDSTALIYQRIHEEHRPSEDMMTEAKSNKKTLFSAVEFVICLMREVELQEEATEQAKLEAAKGGTGYA
ncbi:hypothetical protein K7X08_011090 [Anisodus acutangulus]|uniref:CUE domain-containing protein n=1 Tax=Anisodus acutangulus TaxID=402998 RepID=A0A9Q1RAE2_9SOLA|nr:hypothetical protein K7X08_011090 [Anisodus acutangulus]